MGIHLEEIRWAYESLMENEIRIILHNHATDLQCAMQKSPQPLCYNFVLLNIAVRKGENEYS